MVQPSEDEGEQQQKLMEKRIRALQLDQQKRSIVKKYMTVEAYERLMNVRVANHDLYSQLVDLIIAMAQQQRITSQLTEDQLKQILTRLTFKKESTIEFKHK